MQWSERTWEELPGDLEAAKYAAILPVGATEQHGPQMGCGMDAVLADKLCRAVSDRTDIPMLPTMFYGCSIGHSRRWPGTIAAWITGTPPAGPADMQSAFLPSEHMALTFKESFTLEEARAYARETTGEGVPLEDWMIEAARRADGRFRPLMLQSVIEGLDLDEREIAATAARPLAVVSGGKEPFVNNDYLTSLAYRNLWDGKVHILDGLGHMPFWEAPERINPLFARFLDEVTR